MATVAEAEEFMTYSLSEVSEITRIPLGQIYGYVHDGSLRTLLPRGAKRGWRVTAGELRRFVGGGRDGMSDLMEDFAGSTVRDWACAVAWALGIVLITWMVL